MIERLEKAIEKVKRLPSDRPVVQYPYLVYYTMEPDSVSIVHVRHASRDHPKPGEI